MEGKVLLVWVILLLGQLHGYKSCIEKERKALLDLKTYLIPMTEWEEDSALTWTNVTKSDCCQWKRVECNRKSGQITKIAFGINYVYMNSLLNLSLLHPFEEVQSLDLSSTWLRDSGFSGLFDDVEELSALRKLKALDLSDNEFSSLMELQGTCKWKNIQELDLSRNKLVGWFPSCLTSFTGLRVLDLSSNQLAGNVPSSLGNLKSLKYLSLLGNNFKGFFSFGSLANLAQLKVFKLESYSNSLQVEFETFWKQKFQLSGIVLRSCNLEKVPHFLLHQKDLHHVDLSDNKIHGNLPSWVLENNMKLEVLLLQKIILLRAFSYRNLLIACIS